MKSVGLKFEDEEQEGFSGLVFLYNVWLCF